MQYLCETKQTNGKKIRQCSDRFRHHKKFGTLFIYLKLTIYEAKGQVEVTLMIWA